MKSVRPVFWIIAIIAVIVLLGLSTYSLKSGRIPITGGDSSITVSPTATTDEKLVALAIKTLLGPGGEGAPTSLAVANQKATVTSGLPGWVLELSRTPTMGTPWTRTPGAFVTFTPTMASAGTQPTSVIPATSTTTIPPTSVIPATYTYTVPPPPATFTFTVPPPPPTFTYTVPPPHPTFTYTVQPPTPVPSATPRPTRTRRPTRTPIPP
jgi:hypothetical protein